MQFQDLKRRADNPRRFDCTSGHEYHPRCLFRLNEIEINVPDFPKGIGRHKRVIRSDDDAWDYLRYACKLVPELNEAEHLLRVNVCPAPFIDRLSIELYKMYQLCGTNRFPYPGGYFDQPEIYIDAVGIIAAEENALAKEALKRDGKRKTR